MFPKKPRATRAPHQALPPSDTDLQRSTTHQPTEHPTDHPQHPDEDETTQLQPEHSSNERSAPTNE